MGKQVTNKKENLPMDLSNEMEADSGDGSQAVTAQDMAIPFLRILQKTSPQVDKMVAEFIEGAQVGDIINTVTGQIWGSEDELLVIPAAFNFKIIEWRPRELGGGFIGSYVRDVDELPLHEKNEKGKLITSNGNILEDTAEHYVLIIDTKTGFAEQAILTMSSTQLKHSRKWNSMIGQKRISTASGVKPAPRYGYVYSLKTGAESNEHGNWAGWVINDAGMVEDIGLYRAAKAFCASVGTGDVVVKHSQENASEVM